jgi:hypothetical protein
MIGRLFESLETQTQARFRDSVAPLIATLGDLRAFKRTAKRLIAHPSIVSGTMNLLEPELPLFDQLLKERTPKGSKEKTLLKAKLMF